MATRRTLSAKDGADAVAMLDAEKRVATEPAPDGTEPRRCIGSAKFGIEAHEAPAPDFPVQPSQKDGLGRMCKTHWNQYTSALRKASLARKAATEGQAAPTPEVAEAKPAAGTRGKSRASKPKASAAIEVTPDAAPAAEA